MSASPEYVIDIEAALTSAIAEKGLMLEQVRRLEVAVEEAQEDNTAREARITELEAAQSYQETVLSALRDMDKRQPALVKDLYTAKEEIEIVRQDGDRLQLQRNNALVKATQLQEENDSLQKQVSAAGEEIIRLCDGLDRIVGARDWCSIIQPLIDIALGTLNEDVVELFPDELDIKEEKESQT